jgi:hypothetical protein
MMIASSVYTVYPLPEERVRELLKFWKLEHIKEGSE